MRFKSYLSGVLLEGGKAIKTSTPLKQSDVPALSKEAIKRVSAALGLKPNDIRLVGSAGKKPKSDDLSSDIDLVVKATPDDVRSKLQDLSFDGKTHRELKGLNVYSFGLGDAEKHHQVDLIPVANPNFAAWAYQANKEDLERGLKGSHRNELFFAATHYLPTETLESDEAGEPISRKRFYYDLGRGLLRGTTDRKGKKKLKKSWSVGRDKELVTDDPDQVCKHLFGANANRCSTFQGTLDAVLGPEFPGAEKRREVLEKTIEGMKKKGLVVPESLKSAVSQK